MTVEVVVAKMVEVVREATDETGATPEVVPAGAEAVPAGTEAVPAGMEAVPAGAEPVGAAGVVAPVSVAVTGQMVVETATVMVVR